MIYLSIGEGEGSEPGGILRRRSLRNLCFQLEGPSIRKGSKKAYFEIQMDTIWKYVLKKYANKNI